MKKHFIKNSILRSFLAKLFVLIVFLGTIISIFIFSISKDEKYINYLHNEYPVIKIDDSINDKIIKIYKIDTEIGRYSPNMSHLQLKNNRKVNLTTYFKDIDNKEIDDIIEERDSIVKHKGSDTVYIYKSNSLSNKYDYFFIIDTIQY